ncbi:hypothetical protein [Acrocarpospora sp. B8E8]|uniref:hypothetical protein n=1 Tax=Acrocarpospora sp. B8E8 TaxID=3153572 RepID=UPI00325C95D9
MVAAASATSSSFVRGWFKTIDFIGTSGQVMTRGQRPRCAQFDQGHKHLIKEITQEALVTPLRACNEPWRKRRRLHPAGDDRSQHMIGGAQQAPDRRSDQRDGVLRGHIAVFWMRMYGRTIVPKGEARFLAQV